MLRPTLGATAAFVASYLLVVACGDKSGTAPFVACGDAPLFTALPVPATSILAATPLGNLGPPVHTIPTDHVGIYLTGTGVPLSSPGAMTITGVTRATYLVSPARQGASDYAITTYVCDGITMVLGHIQTVVPAIENAAGDDCVTYSTVNETVEQCRSTRTNMSLTAGQLIGTVGGQTAGAFDLGLYDTGSPVFFVNPSRYSLLTRSAVCPYDPFAPDLRDQLYAKLGDPGMLSSGESPQCGSMQVDIAGTARGVWVTQSNPITQSGNESFFAVLAPHPLFPQSRQAFSLGPASLLMITGPGSTGYPLMTTGRVNRRFADVAEDGQIYCYTHSGTATFSYFVRLSSTTVLSIEKITHAAGASPCNNSPSTWSLSGSAIAFIR